ncbi:MAG: hypothetical protein M3Q07_06415 [Pseudobdellovibrionaceae bacterium]|nr:hypothetical protein [Pseudobdellovibrionaceae bacterium]
MASTNLDIGLIHNHLGLLADTALRSIKTEKFIELAEYGGIKKKNMASDLGISRPALYMREARITKKESLDRLIPFVIISDLAFDLFAKDEKKTMEWLMTTNPIFFNFSPFQMAMGGKADQVIKKMKEWLGKIDQ